MSVMRALLAGGRRLTVSWWLLLLLWLVNFAAAVPFAWIVAQSIQKDVGASLVHEDLRAGFDMGWFGEYQAEAEGLASTFSPTLMGGGAFYANLEDWLVGDLFRSLPAVVTLGVAFALLWAFLLGGTLQRLVTPRRAFALAEFAAGCGRYFFRFLRLVALAAVFYYLIYRLQRWLFAWIEESTRDVTVERTIFLYTLAASALVAALLGLVHVVFDYAKIATVVEERRSMALAAVRGLGFVLFYPRTLLLYLATVLLGGLLLALYAWTAPGAGQSTAAAIGLAFLYGQLFLTVRLALRLLLLGGETALYQAVASPPR